MNDVSLQQGMARRMVAGQAMQTGMQVLQASSLELHQIVQQALAANPMLEDVLPAGQEVLADEASLEAYERRDDGWSEFTAEGRDDASAARRDFMYDSIVARESLKEHLMAQAVFSGLEGRARDALALLIDLLDEKGFLIESPEALAERECFSMKDMGEALTALREMDPPGVGAKDVRESLLIQLERRGRKGSLAYRLVRHCWRELALHRYEEAAELMDVTPDLVAEALEVIRSLSPRPGSAFSADCNLHLLPDVVVEEAPDGTFDVALTNEHVPRLQLNERYMEMMSESSGDRDLRQYLRQSFRGGQELIRAVEMRQETILRLARVLVQRQQDFFRYGPSRLKPLGMEDVAGELGVHVSTVSRACRDKYLLCRWGLRELRWFFSVSVATGDKAGTKAGGLSQGAVLEMLRELVAAEDPAKPFSDARLAEALKEQGADIARRTVAKYREQLNILPATLRRRLK